MAGLTASLVKRGIKFINIPTTLLSQVDSSIGGKTGVNSEHGKNLIGSFYQPEMVISDTSALNSLPKREITCGYAEILKHALILDKKLFYWLQKNGKKILNLNSKIVIQKAIYQSCKIKAKIIEKDEKEKDLRMVLNFGHTFAHAFEATTNFSNKINHGESVLLGMLCAAEFAFKNKILKNKDLNLIKEHYSTLNLPSKLDNYFTKKDIKKIIQFMKFDKKNSDSRIKLILISKIGKTLKSRNLVDSILKNYLNSILF
jgi:3-dehydroquinate synthase/shikimate kinase/3-dehydroquinate synthase